MAGAAPPPLTESISLVEGQILFKFYPPMAFPPCFKPEGSTRFVIGSMITLPAGAVVHGSSLLVRFESTVAAAGAVAAELSPLLLLSGLLLLRWCH